MSQGPDLLLHATGQLDNHRYHRVSVDGSADGSLAIAAFHYQDEQVPTDFDVDQFRQDVVVETCSQDDCIPRHLAERYLDAVGTDYLYRSHPERIARHVRAWLALSDPESVHVTADRVRDATGTSATRIMVAASMSREDFVDGIARSIRKAGVQLHRFYCDRVPAFQGDGHVVIASVYLTSGTGRPVGLRATEAMVTDLAALRRRFRGLYGRLADEVTLDQAQSEVLLAGIDLLAQILPLSTPFLDVREVGVDVLRQHTVLAGAIADLVPARFGPKPMTERGWARKFGQLREQVTAITPVAHERVLEGLLDVVAAIKSTNISRGQPPRSSFPD